ncbi:hypothetical protein EVAR_66431_1 [Eumeta japonica]|uniref:Uncharacterized protein n=1 Tax=Eumeta variegata TaxID=151549 RepID=A0A4C1ZKF2_EUMVA|nr:hypothetical protein EVAR_66431_1 [Eumeta japonica]
MFRNAATLERFREDSLRIHAVAKKRSTLRDDRLSEYIPHPAVRHAPLLNFNTQPARPLFSAKARAERARRPDAARADIFSTENPQYLHRNGWTDGSIWRLDRESVVINIENNTIDEKKPTTNIERIEEKEVYDHINLLKDDGSSGPDEISNEAYKLVHSILLSHLTNLFNLRHNSEEQLTIFFSLGYARRSRIHPIEPFTSERDGSA